MPHMTGSLRKCREALRLYASGFAPLKTSAQMLGNMEAILTHHRESTRTQNSAQDSLFSGLPQKISSTLALKETPPATQEERLLWEKELLGLFISGHPLEKYRALLERQPTNIKAIKSFAEGTPVIVGGIIEEAKKVLTRQNQPMLFIRLADLTDSIETVVFPRLLMNNGEAFQADTCVVIKGKISIRNGNPSIICEKAQKLGEKNEKPKESAVA